MSAVPSGVRNGTVKGNILKIVGGSNLVGESVTGTVILIPTATVIRWNAFNPPLIVSVGILRCPVINGKLYPPGTKTEQSTSGVRVVASDQPNAIPDQLSWIARFELEGVVDQPQSFAFNVPTDGTVELASVLPIKPEPGMVPIVSIEDRERAEAAAELAEAARDDAETAATVAVQARDDAEQIALGASDVKSWVGSDGLTRAVVIYENGRVFIDV